MAEIKLMIVEDADSDLEVCRTSVERYQTQKNNAGVDLFINLTECKTVDDALQKIDNSFDGAIIDLKFPSGDDKGKEVWEKIRDSFFRIPVIILTGTPGSIDVGDRPYLISVLKKGEADYQTDILDTFLDIYNTGLTRIIGGRGKIEQTLSEVFLKNLLPQLEKWKNYGQSDTQRTEKALLRFTLNHLVQVLDDDEDQCFPEEVYIYPPLSNGLKTGSIIKKKDGEGLRVILSPACDLVIRKDGNFKTDHILLVDIEEANAIIATVLNLNKITNKGKKENKLKLKNVFGNNYTDYFHWLPETDFFNGGFLNFRKITTCTKDELGDIYDPQHIQISPHFVKDILSRFSSYYARQGQPDIDQTKIIGNYSAKKTEEST